MYKKPRRTFVGVDYVHCHFIAGYLKVAHGYSSVHLIERANRVNEDNSIRPFLIKNVTHQHTAQTCKGPAASLISALKKEAIVLPMTRLNTSPTPRARIPEPLSILTPR